MIFFTAEAATFHSLDELLGFHPNIKNSTLLDVSHAKNIHLHHPPNLSTITGKEEQPSQIRFNKMANTLEM